MVCLGRYVHITTNMLVQLLVGLPLELVHRWWRIAIVYLSGVLAGSLGSSVFDPKVSRRLRCLLSLFDVGGRRQEQEGFTCVVIQLVSDYYAVISLAYLDVTSGDACQP